MKVKLTREEKALFDSVEEGEWVEIENVANDERRYRSYAKAAMKKSKRINIRLSEADLDSLQRRAVGEGLPYQTLISSILHKYAKGKLQES
jgi:predicted DNA binding CopG/RHH family protein